MAFGAIGPLRTSGFQSCGDSSDRSESGCARRRDLLRWRWHVACEGSTFTRCRSMLRVLRGGLTVLKPSMFITLFACAIALVPVRAGAETFTANATIKPGGGAAVSAPLTATVTTFAADGERNALLAALKKSSTAAREMLAKR